MAAKRSVQRHLLRTKSVQQVDKVNPEKASVTSTTERDITENSFTSIDSSFATLDTPTPSPRKRLQKAASLSDFLMRTASLRSINANNGSETDDDNASQTSSNSILKRQGSSRFEQMMELASQSSLGSLVCGCSSRSRKNLPRQVSFAVDKGGRPVKPEVFTYEGPTEAEKKLVYDKRSEQSIFSSAKWLAACKLVPGAGMFKHAVDSAYHERNSVQDATLRLPVARIFQDVSNTVVFQQSVETIASSDLRGLEQVYSSQTVQDHREGIILRVLHESWLGRKGSSLAKFSYEATRPCARYARMLALADAKEVERYLSGIPSS